jgi:hypothetical protein
MTESKQKSKSNPSLRTPKPKKKLGLSVPPPLRLPHEDLILPDAGASDRDDFLTMPSQTSPTRHSTKKQRSVIKPDTSNTSTSSITSMPSHTSMPRHTSMTDEEGIAPTRDFSRVANSISRDAVPAGLFKGKSKQLYDCLYSMTRGAVVPSRAIRISRPKLMAAAGIGSRVTFETNIGHLCVAGLIAVREISGEHEGNEYTVNLPEEISSTMTRQTSLTSLSRYAQKLVRLVRLETSQTRHTSSLEESTDYTLPNTSLIHDDDDDTHTHRQFLALFLDASREITGAEPANKREEIERWKMCVCVIIDELKKAAALANHPVTSAPAFLSAHLKRRFASKKNSVTSNTPAKNLKPHTPAKQQLSEPPAAQAASNSKSRYSLEECLRFAEHLYRKGKGINNPGGYATSIYRTGEADGLIESFLSQSVQTSPLDITVCPDCKGMSFYYPAGIERGAVARCKHPRVERARRVLFHIRELERLHSRNALYRESDLLEDLKSAAERDGLGFNQGELEYLLSLNRSPE